MRASRPLGTAHSDAVTAEIGKRRGNRGRSTRGGRMRRAVVIVLAVSLSWLTWSVGGALVAPGSDSVAARLAEWGRQHHLGLVINALERAQYEANQPSTGGTVPGGIPRLGPTDRPGRRSAGEQPSGSPRLGSGGTRGPTQRTIHAPTPLVPASQPALSGEGQWQDLYPVRGQVAARVAFLRPDAQHTSYLAQIVWMDPHLVKFSLFPGIQYPGQPATGPDSLTTRQQRSVLAAFNSGFQLKDSHGGYWQSGLTVQNLVPGAASMIFHHDGSLTVEPWRGGPPGASVAAVRQNLTMMISNGTVSTLVQHPRHDTWGATLGDHAFVWRTGIGVRVDGSIVFVLGPALDIASLASLLKTAGAVNAMELDINPAWTNYFTYTHPTGAPAVPHRLGTDTQPDLGRYQQPCSRDFVGVFPRR